MGYSLVAMAGVCVLCTVFESDRSLVNGLVMGKLFWAQRAIPCFCLAVLLAVWLKGGSRFSFSFADLALGVFAGVTYLFYDRGLDPEPDKVCFEGQLLLLWLALRVALSAYSGLRNFFIIMLLCTGAVEAITGLQQLYGMQSSHHHLFRLTGSFYNPGPYSGYLAILVPVALSLALKTRKVLSCFAWLVIGLILLVLPAGMSRTAWIAAILSSVWVYWIQKIGIRKSKRWIEEHKKAAMLCAVVAILLLPVASAGAFLLKKDSANGRLLLWKITAKAMMEQPLGGTGLGGFPAAYARQQAAYFASGHYAEAEAFVAGTPEYAFNEFLQIGVERGIPALLLFLSFTGTALYQGITRRQYGVAGGIGALGVFSLASYPLQLPEFAIVLLFLSAIAITGRQRKGPIHSLFILIPAVILSAAIYYARQDMKKHYREWSRAQPLYHNKAYEAALPRYEALYPFLKHKPEFLFEAGQCQSKTGQYDKAIVTLKQASLLSADPMIHYMIARNEQQRKNYAEAERTLIHAINILPERIYPYYLLVQLYHEPAFYQEAKLKAAAKAVLTKEPKVLSTAIQEMRKETNKILSEAHLFFSLT
jgi:O-antigen ligase